MSHVVDMKMEIKDLNALESACESMGLELVRGQETYKWFGRSVGDYKLPEGFTESDLGKCSHAIRIPGNKSAYEIGVVQNRTGSGYKLLWDFWQGGYGMQAKVGNNGDMLKQAYTTKLSSKIMRKKGFRVTETRQSNGEILIHCKR